MLVIAGGVMLGGLVAGTFMPFHVSMLIIFAGTVLAGAASWRAEQQKKQAARKLAAYPSYKY